MHSYPPRLQGRWQTGHASGSIGQEARRLVACAQGKIADFNAGKLTLLAGCDTEQSLEHAVMGVLNRIRNTASDVRFAEP
jgi:hypothetical protein